MSVIEQQQEPFFNNKKLKHYRPKILPVPPQRYFHQCQRINVEVLIINNICLFPHKKDICKGCLKNPIPEV